MGRAGWLAQRLDSAARPLSAAGIRMCCCELSCMTAFKVAQRAQPMQSTDSGATSSRAGAIGPPQLSHVP